MANKKEPDKTKLPKCGGDGEDSNAFDQTKRDVEKPVTKIWKSRNALLLSLLPDIKSRFRHLELFYSRKGLAIHRAIKDTVVAGIDREIQLRGFNFLYQTLENFAKFLETENESISLEAVLTNVDNVVASEFAVLGWTFVKPRDDVFAMLLLLKFVLDGEQKEKSVSDHHFLSQVHCLLDRVCQEKLKQVQSRHSRPVEKSEKERHLLKSKKKLEMVDLALRKSCFLVHQFMSLPVSSRDSRAVKDFISVNVGQEMGNTGRLQDSLLTITQLRSGQKESSLLPSELPLDIANDPIFPHGKTDLDSLKEKETETLKTKCLKKKSPSHKKDDLSELKMTDVQKGQRSKDKSKQNTLKDNYSSIKDKALKAGLNFRNLPYVKNRICFKCIDGLINKEGAFEDLFSSDNVQEKREHIYLGSLGSESLAEVMKSDQATSLSLETVPLLRKLDDEQSLLTQKLAGSGLPIFIFQFPHIHCVEDPYRAYGHLLQSYVRRRQDLDPFCMSREALRLASFANIDIPVSPFELAAAGFYATGNEDETRCYSCGVSHRQWCESDEPLIIHQDISRNCRHLAGSDSSNVRMYEIHRIRDSAPSEDVSSSEEAKPLRNCRLDRSSQTADERSENAPLPHCKTGTNPKELQLQKEPLKDGQSPDSTQVPWDESQLTDEISFEDEDSVPLIDQVRKAFSSLGSDDSETKSALAQILNASMSHRRSARQSRTRTSARQSGSKADKRDKKVNNSSKGKNNDVSSQESEHPAADMEELKHCENFPQIADLVTDKDSSFLEVVKVMMKLHDLEIETKAHKTEDEGYAKKVDTKAKQTADKKRPQKENTMVKQKLDLDNEQMVNKETTDQDGPQRVDFDKDRCSSNLDVLKVKKKLQDSKTKQPTDEGCAQSVDTKATPTASQESTGQCDIQFGNEANVQKQNCASSYIQDYDKTVMDGEAHFAKTDETEVLCQVSRILAKKKQDENESSSDQSECQLSGQRPSNNQSGVRNFQKQWNSGSCNLKHNYLENNLKNMENPKELKLFHKKRKILSEMIDLTLKGLEHQYSRSSSTSQDDENYQEPQNDCNVNNILISDSIDKCEQGPTETTDHEDLPRNPDDERYNEDP